LQSERSYQHLLDEDKNNEAHLILFEYCLEEQSGLREMST